MTKLCCIFNTPSLYRELIYTRIENSYNCDWYFEDTNNNLKEFDTHKFKRVKRLHSYKLGPLYGVKGLLPLLIDKRYSQFLMMGHSRNLSSFVFVILKRLFFKRKKIILWTHGFYGKENLFESIWKKFLFKSADTLLVYGDYACNIMKSMGFDPKHTIPIHNSLNYDIQLEIRNEIHLSSIYFDHFGNKNPTLIFIGRLNKVKRLDMLLSALINLNHGNTPFNLVFIGDGPEKDRLETISKKYQIENQIWFYGACYDEKRTADLIYNADLCISPGNIGLTAMHVMMFGCPAISHNDFSNQMPEFEAIKPGITGNFFNYEDQGSLEQAIYNWFNQPNYDREKIRQYCFDEIDRYWNPDYQMGIFKSIIQ